MRVCVSLVNLSIHFIFQSALDSQLAKVSLNKAQRELFVACWSESASRVSARVRQRTIAPLSLTDSSW